ncbi:AAA family ATPase [Mycobacterium sp. AZCC_0083]|uniref:AAA family ATPase n=1 Tax=Mycobacterium sp. AZCC_0083 TaxID=2735882 RepID=UPI0016227952|nr:AAA family ATPase [Mycobacterium sp. AZCC_0083]MBB5161574.1 putative ATP-dependent endonuclease of OLD family [Mycobacterium sp. AZCC_0083]
MKLDAVTVKLFRNIVHAQRVVIESDVTCLVGKNESGKTTVLTALHRLNPANADEAEFDLTIEYPRWRLAPDRRSNSDLGRTESVVGELALDEQDRAALDEAYGIAIPESAICWVSCDYTNTRTAWLQCSVEDAVKVVAAKVAISGQDLATITTDGSIGDGVASAKALAKEHRESGETAQAKVATAFANELEKYEVIVARGVATDEQTQALWERIPKFFYFSNYDTLPGEINLTKLADRIANGQALRRGERTVVSLLAHAGEEPADFLDDNYDSRKAELQSVSIDLSQQVFKYWKQNTDLAVVFDTDNRIVQTDPDGNHTANRFLKIELRDGRHGDVETNFDTRSSGFQWFFSFFAAFSEYQNASDSVIVLLDEPGTSLHGDAQHEFVEYIFNELGASKQTIYTTHSQHMVDPTRYEKLRAVHDRSTRSNPDLGVSVTLPNLAADRATLLPIESALGYSVSHHLFLGSGQHLAVEGSSDFVYLQRLTEFLDNKGQVGLDPRLAMIPVGGVDNMPAFVALLGRRLKVSALVDGARTTTRLARIKSAAKDNGVPESSIVACSDVDGLPSNADIEDLFATADYLRLYNWTFGENVSASDLPDTSEPILKKLISYKGGTDFDHALPAHELTKRRGEFFGQIDPKTEQNFVALFKLLNATVDP